MGTSAEALAICADQVIFFDEKNIGAGLPLCPKKFVTSNVTIGRFFQVDYFTYIAHDCIINSYVAFAQGWVSAYWRLCVHGTNSWRGIVRYTALNGSWCRCWQGAAVIKDVPDDVVAVSDPAREFLR